MTNVLSWKIRGLNEPNKPKDVNSFRSKYKVGFLNLVETKIKNRNFDKVVAFFFYWTHYVLRQF